MALDKFLSDLDQLTATAVSAFQAASAADVLEAARVEFLGAKNGRLKKSQKGLSHVDKADKPVAGKRFNQAKQDIEAAYETAKEKLAGGGTEQAAAFDPTEPGRRRRLGHGHPVSQTIEELTDIFARLGFNVAEGPEIEDEWHNFEALNIPPSHPARDPLDNFYLSTAGGGAADRQLLLRSQTSTVQIRVMEKATPPVRIVSLGRVYRPDTADATHYPMFHQIEGLMIDRKVTMADLKSVLRMFCSSYLGEEVHVRFRPSFFPFTEPSVEVDMSWHGGWIEMGGAGMVDPNVLQAVGYDPEEVIGFAFGLGVERLCARRHGIQDIREFFKNDVRFLEQF
ncbi:MAG: phenylalanine--tRNA ligase subunit alpha [Planctomycetales bacterium]|nr:phenylalanine--tRNA ligase subunit alpha [Planctomycetales bacterium]NIM09878.1 phenylalanine--tRNA ligase subunit alpha [Planctomycetales bacterium]NIN09316.1 phenylalanine--tRNA ligase subunit alpha [Planctomycetales bacterium]NIN78424.1 phenylalanine--tRNA ligase subunit alpha [Planctomycetales bacterium]NIO35615.1 phenylalanine--tRNA ligase subunit alpha [Planctomycetales bacterium]